MHTFEMLSIDAEFILGFFIGGLISGIIIMLAMKNPEEKKHD